MRGSLYGSAPASSGGVDLDALAAAVWAYATRGLNSTVDADVRYVNGVEITGTGVEKVGTRSPNTSATAASTCCC